MGELTGDERQALADAILAAPPRSLDLSALDALPARWPSLPRDRRVAIRRALSEARALVACAAAHLEAP